MERETEKKVMNLERKPLGELRKIWKKVFEEEAPKHSKKYLIPRLAYRMTLPRKSGEKERSFFG